MGRRKIEIQPIQHDRNRSVTFLKRKNGLFKKAYELGVLCSADVAVIVFGHNHKLYEYCSTDMNSLLQRHKEYSGERDTKGPADYAADKGDGGDDDSDSGGEAPPPAPSKPKPSQSKPKGKGSSSNDAPSSSQEQRFAVPPPLPEPDRAPSRSIKREELPPIITSVNQSAPPITSAVRNTALPSSASGSMRWQGDNAFSATSAGSAPMLPQSYDASGGDWGRPGGVDRRTSWSGGMQQGPSSPMNAFYQPPPISQPAISRPVHLLTPAHSHPTPLTDILAANPHLAQQLGSAASPNTGFNNSGMHELYNNPIFQSMAPQGPPSSSSGPMDMDWRSMQGHNQPFNPGPRNQPQYAPQQSNNLANDLSWLEMLGQGDRGGSEPWSLGDNRDRGTLPKASTPLGYPQPYQPPSLKRPLSSTTPISPPETGGTPQQERENELDADNSLGIMDSDLAGGKRARIQ